MPWWLRHACLLLGAVLLLPAEGTGQVLLRTAPVPVIESISPVSVRPGDSVVFTVRGTGLSNGTKVRFGEGIDDGTLRMIGDSLGQVSTKVAPGAAPGQRQIRTGEEPRSQLQRVRITVLEPPTGGAIALQAEAAPPGSRSAPPPPPKGTGFMVPAPAVPATPPMVVQVTPSTVAAGAVHTLTLSGRGFGREMTLDFGPGVVTLGAPEVVGQNAARVRISVASGAPPGIRTVGAALGGQSRKGPGTLTVKGPAIGPVDGSPALKPFIPPPPVQTPVQPPPAQVQAAVPAPAPKLVAVIPNAWKPGGSYALTMSGSGFTKDMEVRFGEGVEVQGKPAVVGPNQGMLSIKVSPHAKPGTRKAELKVGVAPWTLQAAAAQILPFKPAKQPPLIKVTKIAPIDLKNIQLGKIILEKPDWKVHTASAPGFKDPVTGKQMPPEPIYTANTPLLHDEVLFEWREKNPGVAETYEVRFHAKGKQIASVRLDPKKPSKATGQGLGLPPTWLRPDAKFLAQLLGAMPSKGGGYQVSPGVFGQSGGSQLEQLTQQTFAKADLTWEVAGFRRYPVSGVSGGKETQEVQVEISDRWPLDAPDKPTGLSCATEMSSGLDVLNIDREASKTDKGQQIDTANHTGDRWELRGTFSLGDSPYASHPEVKETTIPGWKASGGGGGIGSPGGGLKVEQTKGKPITTQLTFDNFLVDWGDGTVVPLTAVFPGAIDAFGRDTTLSVDEALNKIQHAYSEVGTYTVRVYQISGDDLQQQSLGVLGAGIGDKSGSQDLYLQAVGLGGGGGSKQLDSMHGQSKAVADRAYMRMCKQVSILPRTDPAVNGPLQLVEIAITGFPGGLPPADKDKSQVDLLHQIEKQLGGGAAGSAGSAGAGSGGANQGQAASVNAALGLLSAKPLFAEGPKGGAVFTACDESITAGAMLSYFGTGYAKLSWKQDGIVFFEEEVPVSPSPSRPDKVLANDPKLWGKPLLGTKAPLFSSPIGLSKLGDRSLLVEARVVYKSSSPNLKEAVAAALGAGTGKPSASAAQGLVEGFGKNPPKLGVLSPYPKGGTGLGPAVYINETITRVAASEPLRFAKADLPVSAGVTDAVAGVAASAKKATGPPKMVTSKPVPYSVVGHKQDLACTFDFKVKDGSFRVTGLQDGAGNSNVTHEGNLFSGKGRLKIRFPASSGGALKEIPIDIGFSQWMVDTDGVTVIQGALSVNAPPLGELDLPGVRAMLNTLTGTAGDQVTLALTARIADDRIQEAATAGPMPPMKASAVLKPVGDWYAGNLSLPEFLIYDSGFRLKPGAVALDLSAQEGDAPNAHCGGSKGWMGVHLGGKSQLTPFDFDLVGSAPAPANQWAIAGDGLCGKDSTPAFSAPIGKGTLAWDSVNAEAKGGSFKAVYKNLRVFAPWLNVELKGTADPGITAGTGAKKGTITLNLTGKANPLAHGPITLQPTNLQFTSIKGAGWAVRSDTRMDFAGEKKPFAEEVWVNGFAYGMNGRAYFEDGGNAQVIALTGKSGNINLAQVSLQSLKVTAPPTGGRILNLDFSTEISISKTLPAAPVPVAYRIDASGDGDYAGSGPFTGSFKIQKPFPDQNPTVVANLQPEYVGGQDGKSSPSSGIRFSGSVDLGLFGGPPVSGKFLLGYQGNDDYWLAKAVVGLGQGGVPLVTPFLNLFEISGGLGYNVALDAFKSSDLTQAKPSIDGVSLFNAGLLVGSPDGFAYAMRGELSVKTSGSDAGARMDYGAWLLTSNHGGQGQLYGYFKYQNGNFDGTMNGKINIAGDVAYVEAKNDAVALHFGDGGWFVRAGTKNNPVIGHVLIIDGKAWAGIGSDGLYAGARAESNLSVGDCDGVCAYVKGTMGAEAKVTPKPSISISADQHFSAGACAWVGCLDAGLTTHITASAPPPYLKIGFSLSGCPIGKLHVSMKILPSPSPGVSAEGCDLF